MKIFVVAYSYDYEGGAVCGVYDNEDLARARAREIKQERPSSDVVVDAVHLNTDIFIEI